MLIETDYIDVMYLVSLGVVCFIAIESILKDIGSLLLQRSSAFKAANMIALFMAIGYVLFVIVYSLIMVGDA